ncbi:MAG TPA: hypothetical protein VJB59_05325 [Bdellovibrionota bacterium]|nr:hypothetical protein [Bdellovibrionota bacterium]
MSITARRFVGVFGLFALSCVFISSAQASEYRAKLYRASVAGETIQGLKWSSLTPRVEVQTTGIPGDFEIRALLTGVFERNNWSLLHQEGMENEPSVLISTNTKRKSSTETVIASGDFTFPVTLKAQNTTVRFRAVGPRGEIEEQSFLIIFNELPVLKAEAIKSSQSRRSSKAGSSLMVSVGPTYYTFREVNVADQASVADFSEIALTGKLSYLFSLSPRWNLGANAFFNFLPLSSNFPGVNAQVLGVNLRIGLVLLPSPPWTLSLMAGIYYSQMFVTNNRFGYGPMAYPQLYPTLSRKLSERENAFVYVKYVPITALTECELAAGLGWSHNFNSGSLGLNLDFSKMDFYSSPIIKMSSQSISLSVGYGI